MPFDLFFVLPPRLAAAAPEERAVAFLAEQVPRWSRENGCFSCHNNGDGARALYAARRAGYAVPDVALADTTSWLMNPSGWDSNRGNPAASDKKLARIQFAAALAEADSGAALREAAGSLLGYQERDGSWQVDTGAEAGSPATWGPVLATYMVRGILEKADAARFREAIARAEAWLGSVKIESVPDAAVLARMGRKEAADWIRRTQTSDGGWGPRLHAPAEVFDTALVLLASRDDAGLVRGGRGFLIRTQLPSGGWPETTRPAGGQSYAQHISTSAWATLALLATRPER